LQSIALPFLILHGENDTLCHPSGSHLLYKVIQLATVASF
jgi:hypothetical protein